MAGRRALAVGADADLDDHRPGHACGIGFGKGAIGLVLALVEVGDVELVRARLGTSAGRNSGANPIAVMLSRSTSHNPRETAPNWTPMFCALPLNCRGSNGRFCHSLPIAFLLLRLTGTGFQPRLA